MKKICYLLLAFVLLQACIKKEDAPVSGAAEELRSLSIILQNNVNFSMFYNAMERAGLDTILTGNQGYTLLLPGDDIFQSLGFTRDSLEKMDPGTLKKFLGNMIVPGKITSDSIPQTINYPYTNLNGDTLRFSVPLTQQVGTATPRLDINGNQVVRTNILASNGVIQAMGTVLQPPAATVRYYLEHNPNYTYYVRALHNFGLLESLDGKGPFVVIAPTNTAFLNHGYDSLAVEAMDTLHYKKFLFGAPIINTGIFFQSDFQDAPMPAPYVPSVIFPVYITPNYAAIFYSQTVTLAVLSYIQVTSNYNAAPYYGNPYVYGEGASMDDPDHLARNGIVHGSNGLLVFPTCDSVGIR